MKLNNAFYNIADLDRFLDSQLKRSPKLTLSTSFLRSRQRKEVTGIGDYPLLHRIVFYYNKRHHKYFSRKNVRYVLTKSEELSNLAKSEKTQLINTLFQASQPSD